MSLNVNRFFLDHLPESPGIYRFFDEKGRLLYIGKSKNLKKRIASYFRKQNDNTHERTLRMIFHIHDVQITQTDTELEALILEDKLIKQHLPPYNVKQKKFKEQVYIVVTSDAFPALKIISKEEVEFFNHIFGHFKDKYTAEYILSIISKVLNLRSCTDPTPVNICLLVGIGKCLGPCQNDISASQYQEIVNIAIEFLKGNPEPISERISQQIESAARQLDFEEAARWRDLNEFCRNFCQRQEFTTKLLAQNVVIFNRKKTFLFQRGRFIKVYKQKVSEDQIDQYFQKSDDTPFQPENIHHLIDRAYVIWVWVKQNKAKCEFLG